MKYLLTVLTMAALLIGVSCSKNAKVTGVVVDAGNGQGLVGVETWATSDDLGKKVVGKTGKGGVYSLSLPASEWLITMNPILSPSRLQSHLAHASSMTRVYEKEKRLLDTTWLLPCPTDSTVGVAYIVGRGSGIARVEPVGPQYQTWMGKFFNVRPTFTGTREPCALLAYDPDGSFGVNVEVASVEVHKATRNTFMASGPIPDLWYVVPGQQARGTSTSAVGSWSVVAFPRGFPPGEYRVELPGVTSYERMLLFEVLDNVEPVGDVEHEPIDLGD